MLLLKRLLGTLIKNNSNIVQNKIERLANLTTGRGYKEELYSARRFEVKHGNFPHAIKQLNAMLNEGISYLIRLNHRKNIENMQEEKIFC